MSFKKLLLIGFGFKKEKPAYSALALCSIPPIGKII